MSRHALTLLIILIDLHLGRPASVVGSPAQSRLFGRHFLYLKLVTDEGVDGRFGTMKYAILTVED